MKLVLELTTEEFKAAKGKTLEELLNGKGKAKTSKKPAVDESDEDEEVDEEEETDEDEEAEDEDEVDDDMLKEQIAKLAKQGKDQKIKATFAKFKCKTISGLKKDKYAAFLTELKKK